MIGIVSVFLLGILGANATAPPDITGTWHSEEWGDVEFTRTEPGSYHGVFADDSVPVFGSLDLKWSRAERRFNGTWREDRKHFGKVSLRLHDDALRGAWTSNKASRRELGTPELADFTWPRAGGAAMAIDAPGIDPNSMKAPSQPDESDPPIRYNGHPVTWWLDAYWKATVTDPETPEAASTAIEAIEGFRNQPDCDPVIQKRMSVWFATVGNERDATRLKNVARALVVIAGSRHQRQAVACLFQISAQNPEVSYANFYESVSKENSILIEAFSFLELNPDLAIQFAEKLTCGTSNERLTALIFFARLSRNGNDLSSWVRRNSRVLVPAFVRASQDEQELVRRYALVFSTPLKDARIASRLMEAGQSDPSSPNRGLALSLLLHNHPLTPEVLACVINAIESDASFDVKAGTLGHLTIVHPENEIIHPTLMKWAHSGDTETMQTAIQLQHQHPVQVKRPQAIDELMEILSDREWGLYAEISVYAPHGHYQCVRQHAISTLGAYESNALRALPLLEAETNPKTIKFARHAMDLISGYCADLPLKSLQGKWQLTGGRFTEGQPHLLPLEAGSSNESDTIIEVAGTQLLQAGKYIGQLSQTRGNSEQLQCVLFHGDSERQRLTGNVAYHGGNDRPKNNRLSLRLVEKSPFFPNKVREDFYEFQKIKNND